MKRLILFPFCFGLIWTLCGAVYGATINVPADQPTIQAGIDAASAGDIVLVADGTYTGEGNKNLDFKGKAITVQSESGPDNCIIDCENDGRGFHFHSGEEPDSMLSGFTIRNGIHYTPFLGGAVFCENSSPTIVNCVFSDNQAGLGGAICCENSSMALSQSVIANNSAMDTGGIACLSSMVTISECTIKGNTSTADPGTAGVYGDAGSTLNIDLCEIVGNVEITGTGGIYSGGNLIITNCKIAENKPSGIYCNIATIENSAIKDHNGGGGITCWGDTAITNCLITGNKSNYGSGQGGGITTVGSPQLVVKNCIISNNYGVINGGGILADFLEITNSIIANNESYEQGGGIDCGSATITNCSICDNTNSSTNSTSSGIYSRNPCAVTNSILWGNSHGQINEISDDPDDPVPISHIVTFCDIDQDGYAASNGNIRQDPLFADNAKYHLGAGSPCIDKGDNSAPGLSATDFEGDPRIVDGDGDGTAVVDMGADEFVAPGFKSQLYAPVPPCRIVDTRVSGAGGPFIAGEKRKYRVYGSPSDMIPQGGNSAGCPSPEGEPSAVHLNVTAVPTYASGNFKAYSANAFPPNASLTNYKTGAQNIANAGTIKTFVGDGPEIEVMNSYGVSFLVIDVMGYYYPGS